MESDDEVVEAARIMLVIPTNRYRHPDLLSDLDGELITIPPDQLHDRTIQARLVATVERYRQQAGISFPAACRRREFGAPQHFARQDRLAVSGGARGHLPCRAGRSGANDSADDSVDRGIELGSCTSTSTMLLLQLPADPDQVGEKRRS